MQAWFAMGFFFFVLGVFLLRKPPRVAPLRDAPLEGEALRQHIRAQAAQWHKQGYARIRPLSHAVPQIREAYQRCGTMQERESLLPAAQWLVDNVRTLEEAAVSLEDALRNGPRLPAAAGTPRVLLLARELIAHVDAQMDADKLTAVVTAWQEEQSLTEAELWALPLAIRHALVALVRDMAQACAHAQKVRREAEQWAQRLAQTPAENLRAAFLRQEHNPIFLERLLQCLLEQENAAALSWLDTCLLQRGLHADQVVLSAHAQQTLDRLWMGNAITSLRTLSATDWRSLLESLSVTHAFLSQDPAQTYLHMDFASRCLYRNRAAQLAHACHVPAHVAARRAIECAQQAGEPLTRNVGYYLLDEGVPTLWEALGGASMRARLGRALAQRAASLYMFCVCAGTLALWLWSFSLPGARWLLAPLLLPLSEAVRQLAARCITRLSPPRRMPRIAPEALSTKERTLVVVPTLLTHRAQALEMVRHLSVLRFANPESLVEYMLLGDFTDGPAAEQITDADLLRATSEAMEALNQVWGGGFHYLHRARAWDGRAMRFMGHERKRGALVALNEYLLTGKSDTVLAAATVDPATLKGRFRYVLTLDADTQLPPGAALALTGLLAHPLNAPCIHQKTMRGFAVIQPRMEVAAGTVKTRLARYFGGEGGVDPYVTAFSDVYQNLCGQGSFAGKGIYDIAAFSEATAGRIRPGTVLSHDLLEGALAGSALACDTTLFDSQPASLHGWMKRLHRWTRGDWQLLPWLMPVVRGPNGRFSNPLSMLNRFKIYENMRRSLVPASTLLLLLGGAMGGGWPWMLAGVLLPHLHVCLAPSKPSALVALMQLSLLPYEAFILLDATFRTLWRVLFSRKRLLEWVTSADTEKQKQAPRIQRFWAVYPTAACALLGAFFHPALLLGSFPLAVLWLCAPILSDWLDRPAWPQWQPAQGQRDILLQLAHETWRFFERVVRSDTHALPPDNLQMDPPRGIAPRTSPTNMGMYLLACVCAQALELIDADEMTRRLQETVSTLERMETWHGHLYNWYDVCTLQPLHPRYVSSVDGGNLAVCLLTTAQAVRGVLSQLDATAQTLPARLDALADQMDFALLYDPSVSLFYIGMDADSGNPSASHYDLLASEARLLSFLAVSRRDVPLRHWQRLGRAMTETSAGASLLSWGGTMFEYMMPALLLRQVPGTLLGDACHHAALAQLQAYPNGPWGVSESGFWAFDPALNYQYRAFGLPQLALSSTAAEHVIAPYAAALALASVPEEATQNLLHMRTLGWCSDLGFYEAADYNPARIPTGASCQLVRSHMAHHQGMTLAALCNLLCADHLVRLFHALPQVEAYALLLEERKPTQRMLARAVRPRMTAPNAAHTQHFARQPQRNSLPLETLLLNGGGTTLLCDAQGGGYVAHRGIMLTRWRPDPLLPENGPQYYLRIGAHVARICEGGVTFESGRAVYRLREGALSARLVCGVSPLDGAAIALLTLHNHGDTPLTVEACSFFEVTLSTQAADVAHPAFRNLSIQTHRIAPHALLASRRPRTPEEHFPLLLHLLGTPDTPDIMADTDRSAFLGRASLPGQPQGLLSPFDAAGGSTGAVVDPCMSLRVRRTVAPGAKECVSFIIVPAEDEERAAALAAHYQPLDAAQRALELGVTQAEVSARYLGLDPAAQNIVQRLASYLLYPGQPAERLGALARNQQGISSLWRLGISGDLPILTVYATRGGHLPLARTVLHAHEYLRQLGLWFDLVLLGAQGGEYHQPVRDALREAIASSPAREWIGKPGGVFLLDAQALPESDVTMLLAVSSLVLRGDAGSLFTQLAALRRMMRTPKPHWPNPVRTWPIIPLPTENLRLFNGYGGFDADGAYVMELSPTSATPAPWCNVLSNPHFGTMLTERGGGFTWAGNSNACRLTPFSNDAVRDPLGEAFYLRDEETGQYWSITPAPCAIAPTRVRHGQGYSQFETHCMGLLQTMTVFVDPDASCQYVWFTLCNHGTVSRTLSLTAYAHWVLGSQETDGRLVACGVEDSLAWAIHPAQPGVAWLTLAGQTAACITDRHAFLGEGGLAHPRGMRLRALDTVGGESPCAVCRTVFTLAPGAQQQLCAVLGHCDTLAEALAFRTAYKEDLPSLRLDATRRLWRERLGVVQVHTPLLEMDLLLNRWLPYQVTASRLWARAGFYQAGGAIGFRDQLQDMLALLYADPPAVRAHLLTAAAHQFEEGDVQHWWHPPARGVRTRMSDDKLFLPLVTAAYVRVTGDTDVLQERVPYLRNHPIPDGAEDWYGDAEPTDWMETLHAHCLRALHHVRLGAHGLPLIGTGDWNDALNRVGSEGKGESVWLGFFYAYVLEAYAPLCQDDDRAALESQRARVLDHADQDGWDGAWYRRAWSDDGTVLGSQQSPECRIDVIVQSWAVLAGAPDAQAREAMRQALSQLVDSSLGIIKLLWPPFDGILSPGYIRGYLPGVRENGGQYTHGAIWAVLACLRLGWQEEAWRLYRMLLPLSHSRNRAAADQYRVEPYVVAADVYANDQQAGRGGWTWYTGSAAWLYLAGLEGLLGFEKQGMRVRLCATLPQDWPGFSIDYRLGKTVYVLRVLRDCAFPQADGLALPDDWLTLADDGATHEAVWPPHLT